MNILKNLLLKDSFILWVIIGNSFVIFLQGFKISEDQGFMLCNLDNVFTIVFIVEMVFKIHSYGIRGYVSSTWNVFDGILVLLAVPSLLYWSTENTSQLEFLLIFRIARVFKFFRFIRFFPGINSLIVGVQKALKASVVVLMGFAVFNFIISVVSCFLFKDLAAEYFGDPIKSFYTIFRVFTIEGWYEIPNLLAAQTNEVIGALIKLYFVLILIFGGIFGLSLVNSIFVDAMVSDNNDGLELKIDSLEKKIDQLITNHKNV